MSERDKRETETLDVVFHKLMIRDLVALGVLSVVGLSLVGLVALILGIV